jgi:hypothetical protein
MSWRLVTMTSRQIAVVSEASDHKPSPASLTDSFAVLLLLTNTQQSPQILLSRLADGSTRPVLTKLFITSPLTTFYFHDMALSRWARIPVLGAVGPIIGWGNLECSNANWTLEGRSLRSL